MADIIWSAIRGSNAFKVGSKHDKTYFSTERGNLTGRHSIHFSGFTRKVAVDVAPITKKNAQGARVSIRTAANPNKPAAQWKAYRTKGADTRQRATVRRLLRKVSHDRTLTRLAQLKLSKVLRASYRKKLSRATFRANKRHVIREKKSSFRRTTNKK